LGASYRLAQALCVAPPIKGTGLLKKSTFVGSDSA